MHLQTYNYIHSHTVYMFTYDINNKKIKDNNVNNNTQRNTHGKIGAENKLQLEINKERVTNRIDMCHSVVSHSHES